MNYSLVNFRFNEYSKFKNLKTKKEKRIFTQLKKEIPKQTDTQKSWIELLTILQKLYPLYTEQLNSIPDTKKILKEMDAVIRDYEKKKAQKK